MCNAYSSPQLCKVSKNTVGDPAVARDALFHAKHCQRPQRDNHGDSAHATSHTISLHTSIAAAAMPWRSGSKRQQRTPRPKPPTTYATHNDGRVPPRDIHSSSTPRHFTHVTVMIIYDSTVKGVIVPEDAPPRQRQDNPPQQQRQNYAPYRGTSQLSKTRARLTTPPPQQHTHDQYKHNKDAFRATRRQHTPRTSRATLAASAASTSRRRCSADCHNTTATASIVMPAAQHL